MMKHFKYVTKPLLKTMGEYIKWPKNVIKNIFIDGKCKNFKNANRYINDKNPNEIELEVSSRYDDFTMRLENYDPCW